VLLLLDVVGAVVLAPSLLDVLDVVVFILLLFDVVGVAVVQADKTIAQIAITVIKIVLLFICFLHL